MTARIAVLASGRGSNLRALLDYLHALGSARGGDVVFCASDHPGAGALAVAAEHGVEGIVLPRSDPDGSGLLCTLREQAVDLIVLAGYLRLVAAQVIRAFVGRIINVHPALLPAFGGRGMYGERAHRAVLNAGVRVSGVTVHFVDGDYDRGQIIAQWPVPVYADDNTATLAARVLRVEHALLPRVVDAVASGRIALDTEGRVRGALPRERAATFVFDAPESTLARDIDTALGA